MVGWVYCELSLKALFLFSFGSDFRFLIRQKFGKTKKQKKFNCCSLRKYIYIKKFKFPHPILFLFLFFNFLLNVFTLLGETLTIFSNLKIYSIK